MTSASARNGNFSSAQEAGSVSDETFPLSLATAFVIRRKKYRFFFRGRRFFVNAVRKMISHYCSLLTRPAFPFSFFIYFLYKYLQFICNCMKFRILFICIFDFLISQRHLFVSHYLDRRSLNKWVQYFLTF